MNRKSNISTPQTNIASSSFRKRNIKNTNSDFKALSTAMSDKEE
jgi:hypothetical protein